MLALRCELRVSLAKIHGVSLFREKHIWFLGANTCPCPPALGLLAASSSLESEGGYYRAKLQNQCEEHPC